MSKLKYLLKTKTFHHCVLIYLCTLKTSLHILCHTQMNAGKMKPTLLLNRHYIKTNKMQITHCTTLE